ncbi:MAG TPA: site-specific integrase [Chloroflexota bacterium]
MQLSGVRRVVYGKSRAEAQEKLREFLYTTGGQPVRATKITVREFLIGWLGHSARTYRPSTIAVYTRICREKIFPILGHVKLQRLQPLHILQVISPNSRGGMALEVLKSALSDAVDWGLLSENPAGKLKKPRRRRVEPTVWSLEQTQQFLETAKASHLKYTPALVLVVSLGLRTQELLGLYWEDVDGEFIKVRRAATWAENVMHLGETKTSSGRRIIPLNTSALWALGQLRSEHQRIVVGRNGCYPTRESLRLTLVALCEQAGIPRLSIHQLRHQHASLLFAAGATIKEIQAQLGHSQASTTLDIYAHLISRGSLELARRLDTLLSRSDATTPDSEGN